MLKNQINRKKRHWKIRRALIGTPERPRLVVKKSLKHFYAQIIDDISGHTLFGIGTVSKAFRTQYPYGGNIAAAKHLATLCAEALRQKKIEKIAFDRAGYLYHGRIKAFADQLRQGGIQF